MDRKRGKKLIIILFLTGIILLLMYLLLWRLLSGQILEVGCSNEVDRSQYSSFGSDVDLIACYGVIAEERWTEVENGFSLYDHKNKYEVVALDRQGHYKLNGDKILVFTEDNRPKDLPGYGVWYFVDGEERLFTYKLYDEIPKYKAIDIYSGEVTIYPNDLNQIPETERKIFQELESMVK